MKTKLVILISALLTSASLTVSAQTFNPKQSTIEHNDAIRPCIVLNIDPEPKTLKKAWAKFLRKEYHVRLKGKGLFGNKKLIYSKEVVIEQMSSKQMDFYTQVIENEKGSEMKVFASLGYDIYLNELDYPAEFKMMNEMLVSFIKQFLPEYYKEDIVASAKRVKQLKKEIASIEENRKSNVERIEKLSQEVEEYKTSVEVNSVELVVAQEKLKSREEKLERIRTKLQAL